jgi:catechol 2,3-dioxygenase-like lactoylglutathione lyase family enzyme
MFAAGQLVSFLATTDLDRSRAFFERLGLTCVESSPYANVFDSAGSPLRVTLVEAHDPPPFTVLGWEVTDLDAALSGLSAAGVERTVYDGMGQDDRGVWTAPSGAEIAWFKDPDGNTLSINTVP